MLVYCMLIMYDLQCDELLNLMRYTFPFDAVLRNLRMEMQLRMELLKKIEIRVQQMGW